MSFLSPTWVEKAKELASAATELGKRASDIAVEAVEGLKAGQRPELVEIEGRTLVLVKQIGEGGYAFVHLARDPQSGARFAVKRMLAQEEEAARNAAAELALLKSLDHPNIVGLVASSVRPLDGGRGDEYLLALEYCAGGSVAKYLVPRVAGGRPRPLREAKLLAIFVDTCKAIAHLHSLKPPVAHRDLKAENVLEGAKGVHKLCDFGSATTAVVDCATASRKERLDAEDEISRMTTMWNRAPEMVDLHRGKRIDHRVDVWALGTLLYTLALRRHPFETQSSLQILNGGYEMPKASETPYAPSTLQLIIEMLAQDPDRRPSVFDITSKAALLLAEAGTDYGEDDEAVEGGGERGGAYGGLGGAAVVADAQPRDSPPPALWGGSADAFESMMAAEQEGAKAAAAPHARRGRRTRWRRRRRRRRRRGGGGQGGRHGRRRLCRFCRFWRRRRHRRRRHAAAARRGSRPSRHGRAAAHRQRAPRRR